MLQQKEVSFLSSKFFSQLSMARMKGWEMAKTPVFITTSSELWREKPVLYWALSRDSHKYKAPQRYPMQMAHFTNES